MINNKINKIKEMIKTNKTKTMITLAMMVLLAIFFLVKNIWFLIGCVFIGIEILAVDSLEEATLLGAVNQVLAIVMPVICVFVLMSVLSA